MKPTFSICIPSYQNLEYLKLCIRSLRSNTRVPVEILVHDNGSTDGTKEWLAQNNWITSTRSETNSGFCAVNNVIRLASADYVWVFNSDMYCLPGWDSSVVRQIYEFKKNRIDRFTISCCLIEPLGNNPEFTIANFGQTIESFAETGLLNWFLKNQKDIKKKDTNQFSHPIMVPKFMLEEINGFDERYYPGYTSDYDLGRALYEKNCRNFIMLGNARIYHFSSKGFNKLASDDKLRSGHDIFFKKWKQQPEEFRQSIGIKSDFVMIK
ncbi:MAG: glycosyltransferase [Candidatus Parcubacteria bacterium]|nr:glycosyltransferase [Candidatus Parcubacteria bacterium]